MRAATTPKLFISNNPQAALPMTVSGSVAERQEISVDAAKRTRPAALTRDAARTRTKRTEDRTSDPREAVLSAHRDHRGTPCPALNPPLRRDSSYVTCWFTRRFTRVQTCGFPSLAGGRKSGLASCLPDHTRPHRGTRHFCMIAGAAGTGGPVRIAVSSLARMPTTCVHTATFWRSWAMSILSSVSSGVWWRSK